MGGGVELGDDGIDFGSELVFAGYDATYAVVELVDIDLGARVFGFDVAADG